MNFRCGTHASSLFRGELIWCGLCRSLGTAPALETGDLTI